MELTYKQKQARHAAMGRGRKVNEWALGTPDGQLRRPLAMRRPVERDVMAHLWGMGTDSPLVEKRNKRLRKALRRGREAQIAKCERAVRGAADRWRAAQ